MCPTLCDPRDGSPPGSPVLGILQARTLEWVAISFSNAWKWKVKVKSLSRVRLLATPWIAAYQAPPSMGFSRQEYWSGVPLPSPEMLCSTSIISTFHGIADLGQNFGCWIKNCGKDNGMYLCRTERLWNTTRLTITGNSYYENMKIIVNYLEFLTSLHTLFWMLIET